MTLGRFVSCFVVMILVGLLQLWILFFVLELSGKDVTFARLLGDGGLFFFATTLCASSALALLDAHPFRLGDLNFNITAFCCLIVLILAVLTFGVVHAASFGAEPLPFAEHTLPQVMCALTALAYWFFVGARTGWFHPAA